MKISGFLKSALAMLGLSTIVTACYGTPYTYNYAIKGKVLDSDGNPIPGIQVQGDLNPHSGGMRTKTDNKGKFEIQVELFGTLEDQEGIDVAFVDVDGEENGLFLNDIIKLSNKDFEYVKKTGMGADYKAEINPVELKKVSK